MCNQAESITGRYQELNDNSELPWGGTWPSTMATTPSSSTSSNYSTFTCKKSVTFPVWHVVLITMQRKYHHKNLVILIFASSRTSRTYPSVNAVGYCCNSSHARTRTHTLAHSVWLPWTSDKPLADASTYTRDIHPCSQRDSTSRSQQLSGRRRKILDRTSTGIYINF
jgi:hypothetical protein